MDLSVAVVGFGLRSGLWRHAHKPGEGAGEQKQASR